MRGFTFSLESVLSLRRHREESLQWQLAETERALEAETARLRELDLEIRSYSRRIAGYQAMGPLDVNGLLLESGYLSELERQRAEQARVVERLAQRVAEAREALVRAARDKRAIETVREVLLLAFMRETARAEQKSADEMATVRHVWRQSSSPGTSAP